MKLKSTGDLVCVCDDQHMLHLTHSVRKDVVGWDVLTSPSNNVSDICIRMLNKNTLGEKIARPIRNSMQAGRCNQKF